MNALLSGNEWASGDGIAPGWVFRFSESFDFLENYVENFNSLGVFTRVYGRDIWCIYRYIYIYTFYTLTYGFLIGGASQRYQNIPNMHVLY